MQIVMVLESKLPVAINVVLGYGGCAPFFVLNWLNEEVGMVKQFSHGAMGLHFDDSSVNLVRLLTLLYPYPAVNKK